MSKVVHKAFSGFTACCTKWISQSSNVLYSYNVKKVTCKRCLAKLKKEKARGEK